MGLRLAPGKVCWRGVVWLVWCGVVWSVWVRGAPHLVRHSMALSCARQVGMTERATRFAMMRGLAKEIAALWVARRQELGHPLGVVQPPSPPPLQSLGSTLEAPTSSTHTQASALPLPPMPPLLDLATPGTVPPPAAGGAEATGAGSALPRMFVLEVGTEELPPHDLDTALGQLRWEFVRSQGQEEAVDGLLVSYGLGFRVSNAGLQKVSPLFVGKG